MSFRELLDQILQQVEGSIACSLMGMDGIPVETRQIGDSGSADISSLLVDYGSLIKTLRKTMSAVDGGTVAEFSVNTERLLTIARPVTDDYFIVLALRPTGNYGKGRYALRVHIPALRRQIG